MDSSHYVCVLFEQSREKKVVPFEWCLELSSINQIVLGKKYKVFFSTDRKAVPVLEDSMTAFILKYYSNSFY